MRESVRQLNRLQQIRGNSLLIAMVVLLAFALLVLAGSHYLLGEQRISANQNDRQFAFQLAELALRDGEQQIDLLDRTSLIKDKTDPALYGASQYFTENCTTAAAGAWTKGLCLTAARAGSGKQVAWKRTVTAGSETVSMLHPCGNGREYIYETGAGACSGSTVTAGSRVWSNPRYIVELIDKESMKDSRTGRLYRITAQAWGRNKNTQVTLQSFFFIPLPTDKPFGPE